MDIYNMDSEYPIDYLNDELLNLYLKEFEKIQKIVDLNNEYMLDIACQLNRENAKCYVLSLVRKDDLDY
jgi:hypothetical protein